MKKILFLDTETNGLPVNFKAPPSPDNWPRLVQVAWVLANDNGDILSEHSYIIQPDGFDINPESAKIHGITTERARAEGLPLQDVIACLEESLIGCDYVVCHNVGFDRPVIVSEYMRLVGTLGRAWADTARYPKIKHFCTMQMTTPIMRLPSPYAGQYKWPKLDELYQFLFLEEVPGRETFHDAMVDVRATAKAFFKLKELKFKLPDMEQYGYHVARSYDEESGWMEEHGEKAYYNHKAVYDHFNPETVR